jgi:hypothetical protein
MTSRRLYGVDRPVRTALLNLHANGANTEMLDRGDLDFGDDLATWMGFERDATVIHIFEMLLVPSLLQTFPYARAVITDADPSVTEQEVDEQVNAGIAQQSLLRSPSRPELNVILHEAALKQRVGGADVMRDQLGYLLESSYRPRITIRIVPAEAGEHAGMSGPFTIMDYPELPSLIHLKNKVGSLYLENESDLAAYKQALRGLHAIALPPDRSADLISKVASNMT